MKLASDHKMLTNVKEMYKNIRKIINMIYYVKYKIY